MNERLRAIFYIAGIIMFISFALLAARGYIMVERVEVATIDAIDSLQNKAIAEINETRQDLMNSVSRVEVKVIELMDDADSLIGDAEKTLGGTEIKIDQTIDDLSVTMNNIQTTTGDMGQRATQSISRIEEDTVELICEAEEIIENIDGVVSETSEAIENIDSMANETTGVIKDMKVATKEIGNATSKIENLLP